MGDGLPSFAPQWLKSGSTSALGAGTHHNNSASKEDTIKSGSWRDSGSRLGLGAGADRDTPPESKAAPSSARRQGGNFHERKGYGASSGDRGGYRQTNGRPLSDRELVEQTSSLKLRPVPRSSGDAGFLDDSFHLTPPLKNGERGFGARPGPGQPRSGPQRKPSVSQWLVPAHHRAPERDFATLGRQQPVAGVSHSRLVGGPSPSPRSQPAASAPDHQWTSHLADAPTDPPPTQGAVEATPSPATVTPEPAAKQVPRMADAILQAQVTAAQEAEAAKAAKARMEQLALRQSKQLVPVIAAPKSKHSANPAAPTSSSLNAPKKPTGMESLGRPSLSSLTPSVRKDEDSSSAGKRTPPPGNTPPSASREAAPGIMSPKMGAAAAGKPARDRLTFFSSLRRKTSGGELTGSGEHSHLLRQASSNASEAASAADPLSPKVNGGLDLHPLINGVTKSPGGLPEDQYLLSPREALADSTNPPSNILHGNGSQADTELPVAEMTPEEVAFMRSLGWEDVEDDAEGGLTEEEVAAFKAKYPNSVCKGPSSNASVPLNISSPARPKTANSKQRQLPHSFHSELEFSDSDCD